ncbi:MAG: hypothetical protein BWZ01_03171 [Deltaproteobacteria bacterium ADurb.BinA179]|nr:MAG: hypothetical protein BWZ01_03171 [Deltaproteobacteria bacterium ADurb.BinA179]
MARSPENQMFTLPSSVSSRSLGMLLEAALSTRMSLMLSRMYFLMMVSAVSRATRYHTPSKYAMR